MKRKWLALGALPAFLALTAPAKAQTGLTPLEYPAGSLSNTAPASVPLTCYIVVNGINVPVPFWTPSAVCPSTGGGGGGGSSSITSTVSPLGAANVAPAQVSMSTTAAQIVAARTGAAGTGRVAVTIVEPSTCGTLYVGPTIGVTTSTGFPIVAGAAITLNITSALYGILASGTCITPEVETY